MKVERQKIGLPTQGKTTDYTDPRNPYITKTQNTKKLLRRKSETKKLDTKALISTTTVEKHLQ